MLIIEHGRTSYLEFEKDIGEEQDIIVTEFELRYAGAKALELIVNTLIKPDRPVTIELAKEVIRKMGEILDEQEVIV